MNTIVTSKEKILEQSRAIIREKGVEAVNIRSVAAACNVSVGSIYNYFDSKAVLVGETIESIWYEIFHTGESAPFTDTEQCIIELFRRAENGSLIYPDFFKLHPMIFSEREKRDGRQRMSKAWRHIPDSICAVLKRDRRVREGAFTPDFTEEMLSEVLFSLILSAFLRQDYNSSAVTEILRRTIY